MNSDTRNIDATDTRLDWALATTIADETPPDLGAATVARWRAGEAASLHAELAAAQRTTRRAQALGWWMAALVVLAFALWPREAEEDRSAPAGTGDASTQDPKANTERKPTVSSRAEVDALPAGTLGVVGQGLDDEAVRGLLRLQKLKWLELRYPEVMTTGLGLKTPPPQDPKCITADSFEVLGSLSQLRTLRLVGAWRLTESFPLSGTRAPATAQSGTLRAQDLAALADRTVGQLERLPLLRELAMTHFDVPAWALAPLPRFGELRELDLSANYGVDAEAVDVLVRCRRLERLVLTSCMALPGAEIAKLGQLESLADLDVGDIDGMQWRSAIRPFLGPVAQEMEKEAHRVFGAERCGVTDEALAGLSKAKSLRRLRMSQPACTLEGVQVLKDFPALVDLDVFGFGSEPAQPDALAHFLPQLEVLHACGGFGNAFCKTLRETQTKLRVLELPACYAIDDHGLADLVAIPSLRELDVRQSRGLSPAAMDVLRNATQLEVLDLRHVDWVTKQHEDELRKLPNLRSLTTSAER